MAGIKTEPSRTYFLVKLANFADVTDCTECFLKLAAFLDIMLRKRHINTRLKAAIFDKKNMTD